MDGSLAAPAAPTAAVSTTAATPAVSPTPAGSSASADRRAIALLLVLFVAVVAVTWRRWGVPELDAGAELTTADLVAHGATPYGDVRYFYGPLGLYALAGTFRIFGTSLATAYAFGLVQTAAILVVFYALARQWLTALWATLGTATLLAVAFTGTAYDFVLPHTNSATLGLLLILLVLLALARGRVGWAGVACGLVGLTRPEYVAVVAAIALAFLVGVACERRGGARAAALRLAAGGLLIPAVVLGAVAASVGARRLLLENLWPVDFLRVAGFATQRHWMPLDAGSAAGLLARGAIYAVLFGGAVAAAVRLRDRRGLRAFGPLAAAVLLIAVADAASRATGVLPGQRSAIQAESRALLLGMSALPAVAAAAGVLTLVLLVRRRPSPLGRSWPADLALVAGAGALGLRAYNAFTPEASYSAYYAAPMILLLAIGHARVAARWPAARPVAVGGLVVVAAGLLAHAQIALYPDRSATVQSARGSFRTTPAGAAALQPTLDHVAAQTRPGARILAGPANGGLYFLTDRRPALYELMLLPGLLDTVADERAALATVRREHVRTAVLAARDFSAWNRPRFGVDYNQTLGAGLAAMTVTGTTYGRLDHPAAGTYPSRGFRVLELTP